MSEKKKKRGGRARGVVIHHIDPVLKIMRKVLKTVRKPGETGLLRMYRDLQDDNPEKFLAQLQKLESEHTKSINEFKVKMVSSSGQDPSTAKAIELVEELLARHSKAKK